MSLQVQFLTLSLMACCGMALGASFDAISIVAREFRLYRWVVSVLDVLYWAAATLFVFRVLFHANYGQVRLFIFLGLVIGVLLYALLFSGLIRTITVAAIRFVKQLTRIIVQLFRVLILRPLRFVYKMLKMIAGFLFSISIFIGKLVVQWIKLVWNLVKRWF